MTATATFVSGLLYLVLSQTMNFHSSWGVAVLLSSAMGTLMWINSFFKICVYRKTAWMTNTLLSFPMMFFMAVASHLGLQVNSKTSLWPLITVVTVILVAIEVSLFKGKMGSLKTMKGLILGGICLTAVFYFLVEFLIRKG